jgi:hypothetical protein
VGVSLYSLPPTSHQVHLHMDYAMGVSPRPSRP